MYDLHEIGIGRVLEECFDERFNRLNHPRASSMTNEKLTMVSRKVQDVSDKTVPLQDEAMSSEAASTINIESSKTRIKRKDNSGTPSHQSGFLKVQSKRKEGSTKTTVKLHNQIEFISQIFSYHACSYFFQSSN